MRWLSALQDIQWYLSQLFFTTSTTARLYMDFLFIMHRICALKGMKCSSLFDFLMTGTISRMYIAFIMLLRICKLHSNVAIHYNRLPSFFLALSITFDMKSELSSTGWFRAQPAHSRTPLAFLVRFIRYRRFYSAFWVKKEILVQYIVCTAQLEEKRQTKIYANWTLRKKGVHCLVMTFNRIVFSYASIKITLKQDGQSWRANVRIDNPSTLSTHSPHRSAPTALTEIKCSNKQRWRSDDCRTILE